MLILRFSFEHEQIIGVNFQISIVIKSWPAFVNRCKYKIKLCSVAHGSINPIMLNSEQVLLYAISNIPPGRRMTNIMSGVLARLAFAIYQ